MNIQDNYTMNDYDYKKNKKKNKNETTNLQQSNKICIEKNAKKQITQKANKNIKFYSTNT